MKARITKRSSNTTIEEQPSAPDVLRQPDRFQPADDIPADIDLPPFPAEARRRRMRMMIPVPVLTPGGHLQGSQPPDVLAGIHTFRKTGFEMEQAIHDALHVQAVKHSNGAEPEETGPAKEQVSEAERKCDERNLQPGPQRVSRTHQIRAPLLHARRFPLVEPAQMGPPETTMARARHVVDRVGVGVMISMVRDPSARGARAVGDRKKNENLFDYRIEFHRSVGETAVIPDCRSEPA